MSETDALREIPVAGGHLAVLDRGAGDPVVLLHGGGLDHQMWTPQIEPLLASGYRVIAPDARGHGASSTPDAPFRHVDDLVAVLDALQIESAVLVGLSMGASIAIDTAIAFPDRVSAVVVSGAAASNPEFRDPWVLQIFQTWAEAGAERDAKKWLDAFLLFVPGPHRELADVDPDVVELVRELGLATLQSHVPDGQPVLPIWVENAAERQRDIAVPVLAIHGGGDADDHLRMPRELVEAVVDGAEVTIPIVAHYPNLEFPADYNRALLSFLRRLGS